MVSEFIYIHYNTNLKKLTVQSVVSHVPILHGLAKGEQMPRHRKSPQLVAVRRFGKGVLALFSDSYVSTLYYIVNVYI